MLRVELVSRTHNRAGFDCGNPLLNTFLKTTARQHGEKGVSRTFVLVDSGAPSVIIGFFTLTLSEVEVDSLSPAQKVRYPQHKLPAVRLARLGVSNSHKRKGYGGMLVAEAVSRTLIVADQAGSVGLFVDAKDRDAIAFYEHFGFVHIPDRPSQLFLPIKTLRASQSTT